MLAASLLGAQDANQILTKVTSTMNKAKDYSADLVITPDIPLVNIQPVKATVYFKAPAKFSMVSTGIAILPKQGFMELNRILNRRDLYTAVSTGTETIGSVACNIITLLPVSDTMDLILAKLWVDNQAHVVRKALITTRSSGSINVEYSYGSQIAYGLPDLIRFVVDVKKFKMPKGVATDLNRTKKTDDSPAEKKSGTILLALTNYKVNSGLSDELFKNAK